MPMTKNALVELFNRYGNPDALANATDTEFIEMHPKESPNLVYWSLKWRDASGFCWRAQYSERTLTDGVVYRFFSCWYIPASGIAVDFNSVRIMDDAETAALSTGDSGKGAVRGIGSREICRAADQYAQLCAEENAASDRYVASKSESYEIQAATLGRLRRAQGAINGACKIFNALRMPWDYTTESGAYKSVTVYNFTLDVLPAVPPDERSGL